jgi:hypothetical protein
MKGFALKSVSAATRVLWVGGMLVVLAVGAGAAPADSAPPAGVPTEDGMRSLALQWFAQMQAGKIDRSQYTASYGAQLTDDAVRAMSQHINQYGASPLRAEIMQKRTIDNQTFYQVKLVFPRGDATALLFGFDAEGRHRSHEHGRRLSNVGSCLWTWLRRQGLGLMWTASPPACGAWPMAGVRAGLHLTQCLFMAHFGSETCGEGRPLLAPQRTPANRQRARFMSSRPSLKCLCYRNARRQRLSCAVLHILVDRI